MLYYLIEHISIYTLIEVVLFTITYNIPKYTLIEVNIFKIFKPTYQWKTNMNMIRVKLGWITSENTN